MFKEPEPKVLRFWRFCENPDLEFLSILKVQKPKTRGSAPYQKSKKNCPTLMYVEGTLHRGISLLPKSARDHRNVHSHVPCKEVAHNTHATFWIASIWLGENLITMPNSLYYRVIWFLKFALPVTRLMPYYAKTSLFLSPNRLTLRITFISPKNFGVVLVMQSTKYNHIK
jgi:hypothetical protein